jgi:hypothetical protein
MSTAATGERAEKGGTPDVSERIADVDVSETAITFERTDGRSVSVPLGWSWRLEEATPAERQRYEISPSGYSVHWPEVGEDLSAQASGRPGGSNGSALAGLLDARAPEPPPYAVNSVIVTPSKRSAAEESLLEPGGRLPLGTGAFAKTLAAADSPRRLRARRPRLSLRPNPGPNLPAQDCPAQA